MNKTKNFTLYQKSFEDTHIRLDVKIDQNGKIIENGSCFKLLSKKKELKRRLEYLETKNGMEVTLKYRESEQCRIVKRRANAKSRKTEKGFIRIRVHVAKRRHNLGWHRISFEHPGCVWHHVNRRDVVACVEKIHQKFNHSMKDDSAQRLEGVLG